MQASVFGYDENSFHPSFKTTSNHVAGHVVDQQGAKRRRMADDASIFDDRAREPKVDNLQMLNEACAHSSRCADHESL